ncbi:hypothetical protein TNCV_4466981 [Trichonephila clavipes]|nr:hypothetical protein TNCV_4466981 [Trichonephila clavipes]
MSLADGQQTTGEALTTQVMVEIEGRSVLTKFIISPKGKGNRTLLGTDFLSSADMLQTLESEEAQLVIPSRKNFDPQKPS